MYYINIYNVIKSINDRYNHCYLCSLKNHLYISFSLS